MSESDQVQVKTSLPTVLAEHRTRLRAGFSLCCAAFALALMSMIGTYGAELIASSTGVKLREDYDPQMKLVATICEIAIDGLLIAGLVCLYLAPNGHRWRVASTALLTMVGVDVAILCFRLTGGDAATLALAEQIGMLLGWVELWLIAVLGAEAAEALERPDLTNQTEAVGRLIIWGGATWMAFMIWSFDFKQLREPTANAAPDYFAIILSFSALALSLFALSRTMLVCGGLAAALSPTPHQTPPGQPV